MKIIGEKINGTRKRVAQAIAERDADFIKELAQKQAEAESLLTLSFQGSFTINPKKFKKTLTIWLRKPGHSKKRQS